MKPCEKCVNIGYLVSEEPCKSCNGFNNFEPISANYIQTLSSECMTIDEAIKHCEEVAKEKHTRANKITSCGDFTIQAFDKELTSCRECAEEHEQLAEWLKQLQEVKKIVNEWDSDIFPTLTMEAYYFQKILEVFKE